MKPIISIENLGKMYRIRHGQEGSPQYKTFRETLMELPKKIFPSNMVAPKEDFWALRDVNFDVMPGERIGIIGRNGAGKSTLLKLLSRITEPTTGKITLNGRVASLLEVGTGFHPELTGRENVYLNGAILGMHRWEIKSKFDEIVDFSGVEKFLDTPVKRYSSGMYVRLAFAVAAHLDPEILIVDEVLAVGDAEFQKKCLGKMEEVSKEQGRTVLFVSHNMATISALCERTILLQSGSIAVDADTSTTILNYYGGKTGQANVDFSSNKSVSDDFARLLSVSIHNAKGELAWEFDISDSIVLKMKYEILKDTQGPAVPNLHFMAPDGSCLFVNNQPGVKHGKPGIYCAKCTIPPQFLNTGQVSVGFALTSYGSNGLLVHFFAQNALTFVVQEEIFNNPLRYGYGGEIPGAVRPQLNWAMEDYIE